MKKWIWIPALLVAVLSIAGFFLYPTYDRLIRMETVSVDPELTVFLGGGGNSLVLTSVDKKQVLLVDTKVSGGSQALRDFIDTMGPDVDLTVINTHYHPDHVGGNQLFPKAKLISGAYDRDTWQKEVEDRYPDDTVAPGEKKSLSIGKETVILHNYGQAHTFDDMVVYLKNRKLLMTGDLLFMQMHPVLREDSGVNIANWIRNLDSIAADFPEAETILPGHGKLQKRDAIDKMKDYFVSVRDALDNPEALPALKEKFRTYYSLPFSSSFDMTVEALRRERESGRL